MYVLSIWLFSELVFVACVAAGRCASWGMDNPQGTLSRRKNVDFTYCFGCGPNILHPEGTKYVGGHCNVPHIYNNTMI
jgi:hypothetical protein